MTAALGAATVMPEVVLSAMLGAYLSRRVVSARARCCCWPPLPVQGEWAAGGPEMTDVHAFGAADAQPAGRRLVHVAEQGVPGLGPLDRGQQRLAADLHPPGHRVEQQVG